MRSVGVGVDVPSLDALVVTVAILLTTSTLGGVFIIEGALHTTPKASSQVPKNLDGKKAVLH